MGWAKEAFCRELAAFGIYSIGDRGLERVNDFSEFNTLKSYEYCIYIDGVFSGSYESFNTAKDAKNTLEYHMPEHEYKIVVLEVQNGYWKTHHFETWIAVVLDRDQKIHIMKKYLCPELQLERFRTAVAFKGTILACFREKDIVERNENLNRLWVDVD